MSTSLLYHAFGIRGYCYMNARHEKGSVIFFIRRGSHAFRRVDVLMRAMGLEGISKSQLSKLAAELYEAVEAF